MGMTFYLDTSTANAMLAQIERLKQDLENLRQTIEKASKIAEDDGR